jgi:hypothetical protein
MTASKEYKDIWRKLQSIPINVIQIIFVLAMVIPLLVPITIPYGVSPPVQQFYETITSLPEGSVVVFSMQLIPFNYGDLAPAVASILNLLMNSPNRLKVILIFSASDAPLMFDVMMKDYEIKIPEWRTYGKDWVRFGYYAGMEAGFAALCDNFAKVFPKDHYGTPINKIPMMENIKSAADWSLLIEATSYTAIIDYEVRQAYGRYGVPCAFAPAGMTVMTVIPYYPHISKGYVMGLGGAAQLNQLQGIKGTLVDSMGNAFSFMSLEGFILAIIGIVAGYMEHQKGRKTK